jgi:hypothetical protein
MTTVTCAKCRHPAPVWTLVLWKGPNGYRRYRLCDKCKTAVQYEWKPARKAVVKP